MSKRYRTVRAPSHCCCFQGDDLVEIPRAWGTDTNAGRVNQTIIVSCFVFVGIPELVHANLAALHADRAETTHTLQARDFEVRALEEEQGQ